MNKNTHMIIVKRHSEDEGAYRYVPVASRNSLHNAHRFVKTNRTAFVAGDIILIVQIDGISDPDINAKLIYGVNSNRKAVEISKDRYSSDDENDVHGFYDYYNELDGDMLISRAFSCVGVELIVKAVYECIVLLLKEENQLTSKDKDLCMKIIKQVLSGNKDNAKKVSDSAFRLHTKYKEHEKTGCLTRSIRYFANIASPKACGVTASAKDYASGAIIELYDASKDGDLAYKNIKGIVKSIITPEVWILAIAEKAK